MSLFTFGAPFIPKLEEADDTPGLGVQNLQIAEHQVAAGGGFGAPVLQVAAGGGFGASGAAGGNTSNFPSVDYFNHPSYTEARLNFNLFVKESTKKGFNFGGNILITCGHASNLLKVLNSKLHMQYLLMVDTHVNTVKDSNAVSQVNKFLFEEYQEIIHPTRGPFKIYRNFRDYIFKPVFATYGFVMPIDLIEGTVMRELFRMWLEV